MANLHLCTVMEAVAQIATANRSSAEKFKLITQVADLGGSRNLSNPTWLLLLCFFHCLLLN